MTLMTGLAIILRSATKITHKAQAVTALSTKWHVCATIDSFFTTSETETPVAQNTSTGGAASPGFFDARSGDSDEDEAGSEEDDVDNTKFLPAYAYSSIGFQKRQALGKCKSFHFKHVLLLFESYNSKAHILMNNPSFIHLSKLRTITF